MFLFLWFSTLSAFAAANKTSECPNVQPLLDELWESYKVTYTKQFDPSDECRKKCTWTRNAYRIIRHNYEADIGMLDYTISFNENSDLTRKEQLEQKAGLVPFLHFRKGNRKNTVGLQNSTNSSKESPKSLDRKDKGVVTSVKEQGCCSSPSDFSSVTSLEVQIAKEDARDTDLSEQNLIDCSSSYGERCCRTEHHSYVCCSLTSKCLSGYGCLGWEDLSNMSRMQGVVSSVRIVESIPSCHT